MKIGEGTEFKIDIKTVIAIIMITSTFVGMYYTLQSDIEYFCRDVLHFAVRY